VIVILSLRSQRNQQLKNSSSRYRYNQLDLA
jgi:hypothetical protein